MVMIGHVKKLISKSNTGLEFQHALEKSFFFLQKCRNCHTRGAPGIVVFDY